MPKYYLCNNALLQQFHYCTDSELLDTVFLAVQNLKMALKKANILYHKILFYIKAFSSDTPQSIKRQNKGPKEHDEKLNPDVDRNRPIRKMDFHSKHIR